MALCGGEIETGTRVDEEWLLTVERKEFVALLRTPETQARIRHTLKPASLCGIEPPSAFGASPGRRLRTGAGSARPRSWGAGAGSARPRSWGAVVGWEFGSMDI